MLAPMVSFHGQGSVRWVLSGFSTLGALALCWGSPVFCCGSYLSLCLFWHVCPWPMETRGQVVYFPSVQKVSLQVWVWQEAPMCVITFFLSEMSLPFTHTVPCLAAFSMRNAWSVPAWTAQWAWWVSPSLLQQRDQLEGILRPLWSGQAVLTSSRYWILLAGGQLPFCDSPWRSFPG